MPGLDPGIHVFLLGGYRRRGWPGHRRAEATPSFGRLCPAMTGQKLGGKARPCAKRLRRFQWRKGASTMTLKLQFRRSTMLAAALTLLAAISLSAFGASPARADRCDD